MAESSRDVRTRIQVIKYAPPPPELPMYGRVGPREASFIGRTNYVAALEEKRFIFGIKREDRNRHTYIVGKSGVGKSKLLELFMRQDIAAGRGLCFIDPDGESINSILDFIPQARAADVVHVDVGDAEHVPVWNPFVGLTPQSRHLFTENVIQILKRQFGWGWTPHMEYLARFICMALSVYPEASLAGMSSMLTDDAYRAKVLAVPQAQAVRRFWLEEFPAWRDKFEFEKQAFIHLANKLTQFMSNPYLYALFNVKENRINFDEIIRGNKIALINLGRRKIGDDGAAFLGAMLLSKIEEALPDRSATRDFYIYLDEAHLFMTENFERMLAETRKRGVAVTLAHQYLGQLPEGAYSRLVGNVGNIIVFRLSGEDAVRLKSEMAPVFDVKDMINLGTQEFYVKMTIDGEANDPFSAETLQVLTPHYASLRQDIIQTSNEKYSIQRSS